MFHLSVGTSFLTTHRLYYGCSYFFFQCFCHMRREDAQTSKMLRAWLTASRKWKFCSAVSSFIKKKRYKKYLDNKNISQDTKFLYVSERSEGSIYMFHLSIGTSFLTTHRLYCCWSYFFFQCFCHKRREDAQTSRMLRAWLTAIRKWKFCSAVSPS